MATLAERRDALNKQKDELRVMFMKVEGALELIDAIEQEENSNGSVTANEVKKTAKKEKVK